jgi:hypothetical protein
MLRWMSGVSANLCPFRAFFNHGKSQKSQELSWVNKADGPFCKGFLSQETRKLLMHHVQGNCHGEGFTCQARVLVFSSEQIPVTLSALSNNTVDSPFVPVQRIHRELSPCD